MVFFLSSYSLQFLTDLEAFSAKRNKAGPSANDVTVHKQVCCPGASWLIRGGRILVFVLYAMVSYLTQVSVPDK